MAPTQGFKMRLWAAGMQIHSTMKTTSPYLTKAAMILAAVFVPATAWWVSWHHQESAKQVEQARAANQKLQAQVAKLQEIQKWQSKVQQQNGLLQKTIKEGSTIEAFAKPRSLNTWNGPTDPDRVWHEQRQKARETLIQFDLHTLDR